MAKKTVKALGKVSTKSPPGKANRAIQQTAAERKREDLLKKIRKEGASAWKRVSDTMRAVDFRGADLSGAKLNELHFWHMNLRGVNFSGSSLQNAILYKVDLQNANFSNCNLTESDFRGAKLQGANFAGATMVDMDLDGAQFDDKTTLPKGFKPPANMKWKGTGARPGTGKIKPAKAAGSLDFADFIKLLNKKVELARMQKASSMLKKEKFQLFAEVQADSLAGIVKSQTDKDLVYSCRLSSTGAFGCGTQNLKPCGGLQGALCKHLLVLIIGLAKAGQLDSATVDNWINLSRSQKPKIDEDAMSATFLKYKGAEAGEIDWRPTETIPEDFYSM